MPSYNDQLEEVILARNAFEKEVIELKEKIEDNKASVGLFINSNKDTVSTMAGSFWLFEMVRDING